MPTAYSGSGTGHQRLVDSLAGRLGRPVVLDDIDLRPLAHSPQRPDEADRVRTVSILSREAPPEAVTYLREQGVRVGSGSQPIRVPSCRSIGLQARFCQPVTAGSQTLGFLWIVEGEEELDAQDVQLVADVAEAIADELSRKGSRAAEFRLRSLVDDLLSSDPAISCDAAASLLDSGAFPEAAAAATLVAIAAPPPGEQIDDTLPVLLNRGLHAFEERLSGAAHLTLARDDEAVVVLAAAGVRGEARLTELAAQLRADLQQVAPGDEWTIAVGIGTTSNSLAGTSRSYSEALQAATVAGRVPQVDSVLAWSEIGIYRLLVPPDAGDAHDFDLLPVPIRRLLEGQGNAMLLHTLETYLDHAGDAQATTAALYLARGSLYYRLHRIEEIAAVDLRSGHDRLMLHLGLKLARILGLYPVAPIPVAEAEPAA